MVDIFKQWIVIGLKKVNYILFIIFLKQKYTKIRIDFSGDYPNLSKVINYENLLCIYMSLSWWIEI